MEPRRSWAKAVAVVLAFALMVSALAYLFFGNTAVAQTLRLSRIQKYQAALTPKLAADPRYKSIKMGAATTDGGGVILIQGTLADDAELQALKVLIASTRPPAHVDYRVVVATK